jgi:hypothetical protein
VEKKVNRFVSISSFQKGIGYAMSILQFGQEEVKKWAEKDLMPKNWMRDPLKGYPNWDGSREGTY